MRTKIHIGNELLIFVLLFLIGCFWCVKGIDAVVKHNNAICFSDLDAESYNRGQYVTGYLDSYMVKKVINLGDGSYSGVSQVVFLGGVEYYFYTVPIKDKKYIRLMVSDLDTIEKLEEYVVGKGESIYIEGQVIEAPVDLNYQWYSDMEEFAEGEVENIISQDVIKEVDIEAKKKTIYPGVVFLFFAFWQYKSMRGIKNVIKIEVASRDNPKT